MNPQQNWEKTFNERLPLFGHRNWLVVADAAYPLHSAPGIETLVSTQSQQATLEAILKPLRTSQHIRPIIYLDQELEFVEEKDAPGVSAYRDYLKVALKGLAVNSTPHEDIIAKLDRAAEMFSILIVKSTMTIPYTSVFFELDCGYWNPESEARLRATFRSENHKP
ncbi:MAG: hypothetical protein WB425_12670 [Terracidiphilus sp.]